MAIGCWAMVGIFTGAGFGFGRGSGSVLGGIGLLGGVSQGRSGDAISVNAATGNLLIEQQDEYLVGRGPDASVGRTYNSLTTLADDNDDKWRQSTDRRVYGLSGTLNAAGSTVKRVSGDGTEIVYSWDAARSAYVTKDGGGAYDTIVRSGSDWVWTDGDTRTVERYFSDANGKIKSVADNIGKAMTFAYDGSGRLSTITTNDGAWIRYDWSGSTSNITQIVTGYTDLATSTSQTLTRTRYGYDGSNRLTSVTVDLTPEDSSIADGKVYVTTYGYDASNRVNSITQSDGSAMSISYDGSGRVSTLVQTVASGVTRTTTLTYGSGYTTVTDPGGQVTRLDYDANGNLTKITAPPAYSGASAQVWQFAYNADGDVTSTTDPQGKVTSYSNFTANGQAQTITDRAGSVTTRTFDAANHLLSESWSGIDATGASVTQSARYAYNAAGDLRFAIGAEGGVTEYIRNSYGMVTSEIRYAEAAYTVAGTPDEAAMAAWAAGLSDKSWVQRINYSYDARMALTKMTSYGIADAAGAGLTTQGRSQINYVYDQAGRLLSTNATGQDATTYVYDGLGRLTASTDAAGNTTSIVFDDANTKTTITNSGGQTIVETYNKAGDLIQHSESGTNAIATTVSYAVDKLGRTRVTSFTGSTDKIYDVYDAAGRHVATVDDAGRVTEYRYDAANRLVGTIAYRNAVAAGHLTTLGNPDNTLALATIRPATHAEDVSSWTIYDAEGRVLQTIAGDGSTRISTYDAAGRLQKTVSYVNKVAAATVAGFVAAAPTAVITPTANAGDVSKRYFYDKDGRLIGTIDGEKYVVRNMYDQAGQLVATTAYANATAAASPATASFNTIIAGITTSAQDRTTRFVHDGRGALRYTIDGLGNAVRYDYDAAGLKTRTVAYAATLGALSDYTFDAVLAELATQEAATDKRVGFAVYDSAGRLAYSLDQVGVPSTSIGMAVTAYIYDSVGNMVRTVAYATARATASLPTKATMDSWAAGAGNAADRVTRMWYTGRGQLAYRVDAEGAVSKFSYDVKGRVTSETIWDDAITVSDAATYAQVAAAATGTSYSNSRTYDALDRVVRQYDFSGSNYTEYSYLGATNLVSTAMRAANGTVQEQSTLTNIHDGAGRVIKATDATGTSEAAAANYAYDGRGVMTSLVDPRTKTTSYTYDLDGRVKTITDAAGGVTTYVYNAFGEVWKVTDARGNASYSWYDEAGRVTTTRDAENYLTTTAYTVFGEIASVKRWATAATGTPVMGTEPAGSGTVATTSFTYDKAGRVLTSVNALSQTESYAYNSFGDRVSVTNRGGAITSYTVDKVGRVTRERVGAATANINDSGAVSTGAYNVKIYGYDTRGNVITLVEGFSATSGGTVTALRTAAYLYDAASRLTTVQYDKVTVIADDMVTTTADVLPTEQFTYDKRGNIIQSIDKAGARTFSYYDDLDRKIAEIRDLSATQRVYTSYAYDANGNLVTTKVYEGNPASPSGDGGGTPPAAPSGLYRQTDFAYDNLNRMTTSTVVSNTGNVITSGSWNGSSYSQATGSLATTYQYDAEGNVVKVTDANGNAIWNWYDKLGRKTDQLDGESYLTHWTYDAEDHVLSEVRYATRFTGTPALGTPPTVGTNGNDRTTVYTYDLNGNRLTEKRTGVAAWSVNATTGALTAAGTDALISYSYNALGQVLTKTVAGSLIATYGYDGTGRLTSEAKASYTDANGVSVTPTTNYEYDAIGDLTRTTQLGATGTYAAADRVTTYRYAKGGRLVGMVDAEGYAHSYDYDVAGNLKKDAYSRVINLNNTVSSSATTTIVEAQTATYDLAGRVLSQAIYSTVGAAFKRIGVTNYQYNVFGQVTQQGTGTNSASDIAAGTALYQVANQYDAAGRLTGTNSGDGVWQFFGYDKAGNQSVAVTSAGAAFTSATGLATALSQVANANVNGTYTVYDKRGQATQVVEEGRDLSATVTNQTLTTSRTYNAFGEVATETNALGHMISYTYNNMGRMIRSESPGVQITNEDGGTNWVKPSEDYYYDLGGRMIATRDANGTYASGGTQSSPMSKAANSGNLTTYALLAGTGYDGGESLVATEFHADGGKKQTLYDRMGDARVLRDELYLSGSPNLHVTEQSFNKLGQLAQVKHNRTTNVSDDTTRLIDNYTYDQFGQRIQHWNNQYGAAVIEKSGYDGLGRVTAQTDMSGYLTTTAYTWNGTLATTGLGTFGGFVTTTTYANSRTSISKDDIFNHEVSRQDLGGHVYSFSHDVAGRVAGRTGGGETLTHSWLNTGLIGTITSVQGGVTTVQTSGYDKLGNKLTEAQTRAGVQIQNATATYDALSRLQTWSEAGNTTTYAADTIYAYDANSNIRYVDADYRFLGATGAFDSTDMGHAEWYRYDSMNRMVVAGAYFSGTPGSGTISGGTLITYDAAGRRQTATTRSDALLWTGWRASEPGTGIIIYADEPYEWEGYHWTNNGKATFNGRVVETYSYDAAGLLSSVAMATERGEANGTSFITPSGTMNASILRSSFTYDRMGRVTSQQDYEANGTTVAYSRTGIVYNASGQVTGETQAVRQMSGTAYQGTLTSYITNTYGSGTGYALGAVLTTAANVWKNGVDSGAPDTLTTNAYVWYDGAVLASTSYKPDSGGSTSWTSIYSVNATGAVTQVSIGDGRPRTVTFKNDVFGQAIRRDEADALPAGDPHAVWYRFNGREMGRITNDGQAYDDYNSSIADRQAVSGTGAFQFGAATGHKDAEFGIAYEAINSFSQGSAGGSYTVRAGDTLQSIAERLYGDANLWYRIAEANGLSAGAILVEGRALGLPPGVSRNANSAATFKPYDPADILGRTSPTTPKPQKSNKCGAFGQILLVAVAIAITAILRVPVTNMIAGKAAVLAAGTAGIASGSAAGIAGAAIAGVAGSVASQSVGVATGIQDKFNWGAVALAGVGAGLGASGIGFGNIANSPFLTDVANGALRNSLTQGIGVATGLQNKFSWAGVAAAGVMAGVGGAVMRGMSKDQGHYENHGWKWDKNPTFGAEAASVAVSMISGAATRSAIDGSSFGDNILAMLPDAVGQLIARAIGDAADKARAKAQEANQKIASNSSTLSDATTGQQMEAAVVAQSTSGDNNALPSDIVVTAQRVGNAAGMAAAVNVSQSSPDLERYGYVEREPQTPEENARIVERGIAWANDRTDLSAAEKQAVIAEIERRGAAWDNILSGAAVFSNVLGISAANGTLSVGEYDIVSFNDRRFQIFGENGITVDHGSVSVGGINGIFVNSKSVSIGGPNGIFVNDKIISIGGTNGIVIGPVGLSIGGSRGINLTQGSFDLGGNRIYSNAAKGLVDEAHVAELVANGVKFTPDALLVTGRNSAGQVVFLESGNARAGLQHIIEQHGADFAKIGVPETDIPSVVMRAVTEGKVVGYQGRDQGRAIYEILLHQQNQRIAVSVSNNGFIVGANPAGRVP